MRRIRHAICSALALCLALTAAPPLGAAPPLDGNQWPTWRGPDNTGASRLTGLPDKWESVDDDIVVWKNDLGGRSTPVIHDGRLYVIRLAGDKVTWQEEVACADALTGEILWRDRFNLFLTDIPSDRVGWSAVTVDPETGYVYAHGIQGIFTCYTAEGEIVWRHSLTEEYGRISGYGGRTHTPLVDGDLVILSFLNSSYGSQGRGMHRFAAFDKRTGEIVWWSETGNSPLDTTFGVPAVAMINDIRQMIVPGSDGWVHGFKVATGEKIWSFQLSKRGINASIIVDGYKVYAMHGEDNIDNTKFGRIVCIDARGTGDVTKTHEIWRLDGVLTAYASPALAEGRLYCVDKSANLFAIDAETGELAWKFNYGREGWGSPTWADGKIYISEVDGEFHIIKPGDTSAELLSSIKFEDPDRGVDIRGCAAFAYGRMYLQTRTGVYCLGPKEPSLDEIPIATLPDPLPGSGDAAHLQVRPAEVHLNPGESAKFTGELFDDHGRLLGAMGDGDTRLAGIKGRLDGDTFYPANIPAGQFGTIKFKRNGLDAAVRIVVRPDLPYEEDFEGLEAGAVPSQWLGASKVKFATVVEEDGNHVLMKNDNIRFTRAEAYFGAPDLREYTLEVDVKLTEKRRRMPDAGLINSRYWFDIRGNDQQLRIVTWVSMPRLLVTIPFEADPDVWYRLKCRVDYGDEGATVRGKAWKRDEAEPEGWMIELVDPIPHPSGAPGLATFSLAPIYYDNLKLTPNADAN